MSPCSRCRARCESIYIRHGLCPSCRKRVPEHERQAVARMFGDVVTDRDSKAELKALFG